LKGDKEALEGDGSLSFEPIFFLQGEEKFSENRHLISFFDIEEVHILTEEYFIGLN
jgi:hypothetical protein